MYECYLCLKPKGYTEYFCGDCQKLKETISLYGQEVHEVVNKVFIRTPEQQQHKINIELKKQIENKKKDLENSKK
tara:strand:- start:268 stop:492 length:225 start_codon:yes stop_codon:yes gene_type:complete